MTIAFIEWLGAGMLWGLTALALPILAHLLSRRGTRPIPLPTARFLAMAQAERGRRLRLSQWLVLLLRLTLVALVALAFARPAWREGPRRSAADGREVVIILDASASMGRVSAAASPMRLALHRASEMLEALDPAIDRAGLVVAGLESESLLPRLTGNFAALRSMLGEVEATPGSADLSAAIGAALRLPGPGGSDAARRAGGRRIILLTDAQSGHLADIASIGPSLESAALSIEAVEGGAPGNLALHSLAVSPARPPVGAPFTLRATVSNHGDHAATVEVTCAIEAPAASPPPALVSVEPRGEATVSFTCRPQEQGAVRLRLALPPDALEVDNTLSATIPIRAAARVLLLTDASRGVADAPAYLGAALRPDEQSPYEPIVADVSRQRPESIDWSGLEVIILCEAGAAPLDWLTRVHEVVARGGGLLWFIDSAEAARASDIYASIQPEAPSLPLAIVEVAAEAEHVAWSSADLTHEAIASFDGPAAASLWAVRHARPARARAADGAAVLIRGEDGSPIVAAGRHGRGRAIVFNGSIARASSDLTRQPLFPALVHEWMGWLGAGEGSVPTLHPGRGRAIEVPEAAGSRPLLLEFIGRAGRSAAACRSGEAEGRRLVEVDAVEDVGEVCIADAESGEWIAGASVVVEPRESDLRAADAGAIAALESSPGSAERGGASEAGAADLLAAPRRLLELWPWLLAAACIAAMLEAAVALLAARKEAIA